MSNTTNLQYSLIRSVWCKKGRGRQGKQADKILKLQAPFVTQSPTRFVCSIAAG